MKAFRVKESLYESIEDNDEDVEIKDDWKSDEEEDELNPDEIDTSDMETADEIDVPDTAFDDELLITLNNELKSPEFARRVLKFRIKGADRRPEFGTVLAKLGNNSFIFKLQDGSLKKFKLGEIVAESIKYANEMQMNENWGEELENDEYVEDDYDDEDTNAEHVEDEDEEYELETIDPEDEEYLMTAGHLFPDEARKVMSRYSKVPRRGKSNEMPF